MSKLYGPFLQRDRIFFLLETEREIWGEEEREKRIRIALFPQILSSHIWILSKDILL
jgi:hypothetical protein